MEEEGVDCCSSWDSLVEIALEKLDSLKLLRSLRPIQLSSSLLITQSTSKVKEGDQLQLQVFDKMQHFDRNSVEVHVAQPTFDNWIHDIPSSGDEAINGAGAIHDAKDPINNQFKKLILFSGNDYLGLSSHPTIGKATAKAALELGMGPRGSALICGYTNYHRELESLLAELKKKEDCLLCPTGFAANMAVMVAIGSISLLLTAGTQPKKEDKVAIFSDALNHASIIDGIRLAERQRSVEVFVYRHCDMSHLNELLSTCSLKKKVVVTDSLFSMDGDFAPMVELTRLRKRHGFLLVIDDAHGTFVCGKNGGGVAEEFNCERDVDICVGTLSKAAGCHGGFIACSKRWKKLIQSRGRSFIFSTSTPVPVAAAALAACNVARKEKWRRKEIWNRVQEFRDLTGIPIASPIISLVVGSEENALQASRHLLKSGFHVTAIRPPTVPPNSCRLRVTLCSAHTKDDVKELTRALSRCINFRDISVRCSSNGMRRDSILMGLSQQHGHGVNVVIPGSPIIFICSNLLPPPPAARICSWWWVHQIVPCLQGEIQDGLSAPHPESGTIVGPGGINLCVERPEPHPGPFPCRVSDFCGERAPRPSPDAPVVPPTAAATATATAIM